MSIPVTDWECPPPEAGERPGPLNEAARHTGPSKAGVNCRERDGRHPARGPPGVTRPRKVFVSQVLAVFGEGEA